MFLFSSGQSASSRLYSQQGSTPAKEHPLGFHRPLVMCPHEVLVSCPKQDKDKQETQGLVWSGGTCVW